jgi:S-adenosylmethionine:tRNA ribosyltransferase-isomerase
MNTADFDYELPRERIAQAPLPRRDAARMMVLHRGAGRIEHRQVGDLPAYLRGPDVLVVNDTRVFPARLLLRRADTGGRVELLLLEPAGASRARSVDALLGGAGACEWSALYRGSARPRPGMELAGDGARLRARIEAALEGGRVRVRLETGTALGAVLAACGRPPVPPYIARGGGDDPRVETDRERYQTIYAAESGAVAAPTAGLHFTRELFAALAAGGVRRATVTLHVGPGTFRPVKTERVEQHVMEAERYEVTAAAAAAVREARSAGGRVAAVGSTCVRTLETVAARRGEVTADSGRTELFIRPPFTFRAVDAMLTNFHLPRSTLLMMVCALAGRDFVMEAYREAVRLAYRFYSYGDCMLIL